MTEPTHNCRLYLLLAHDAGDDTIPALERALDAADVACVALRCAPDGTVDRQRANLLQEVATLRNVAFLLEQDVELAKAIGADGVHIQGSEDAYEAARKTLGPDAIVGVSPGLSRHHALILGEHGADYVAFEGDAPAVEEMTGWWAEIVEVPCVAWGAATLDEARNFARAGADFVAVEEALWRAADKPEEAVTALSLALSARKDAA